MSGPVYFPSKFSPKKLLYKDKDKRKYFDAQGTSLDVIFTQGPVIIQGNNQENVPLLVQLPSADLNTEDIDVSLSFPRIEEEIRLDDNKRSLHVLFTHFNKNPLSRTCFIIANLTTTN